MTPVTERGPAYAGPTDFEPAVDRRGAPGAGAPNELQKREGADPTALADLLKGVDGMTALYALQILARDGQFELGKEAAKSKQQDVKAMFHKIQEAIKKAEEASKKKGAFGQLFEKFGAIAKIAVLVAAVASVAATGGASLIAIAALAGTLMSMFSKQLAKLAGGGETAEKIFRYGGMGLSLAAGGAGIVQAATGAGQAAGTAGSTALREASAWASKGATYVQAGATAGQAATGYARDQYASDELGARADETQAKAERKALVKQMEEFVEFLKEIEKSFTNAKETLIKAIDSQAASDLTLATMGARA